MALEKLAFGGEEFKYDTLAGIASRFAIGNRDIADVKGLTASSLFAEPKPAAVPVPSILPSETAAQAQAKAPENLLISTTPPKSTANEEQFISVPDSPTAAPAVVSPNTARHINKTGPEGGAEPGLSAQELPWNQASVNIRSPLLRLHTEIVEFCRFLEPTAEEAAMREAATQRVRQSITEVYASASVQVFGSFVTGGSPKKGGLVNVQRPAVKGYSIHRCPPLLTVHVKRFQQDMRGRLSKIDGAVPFPLHLDLTPFFDPKAMDTSAQYTLLGFVEHMGTMRSGHYVAYVQRGLNVSDSPHLQSLLHKHGIGSPPITDQPDSNSVLASGKGKKKGAAKASLSLKVGAAKKEDSASGNATATAASKAGRVSASAKRSSKAGSGSVAPSSSASAAEESNNQQNSNDSSQSTGDAVASDSGGGFKHANGHAQPEHSIPEDWESSDDSSANEASQAASDIPAKQANGTHMQTNTAQAESVSTSDTAQELHEDLNGAGQQGSSSEDSARSGEASTSQAQESAQLQTAGPNGKSAATKKDKSCAKEDVNQQEKRAWYYISDTQVKAVTEADVLSREAYILLYMRTA